MSVPGAPPAAPAMLPGALGQALAARPCPSTPPGPASPRGFLLPSGEPASPPPPPFCVHSAAWAPLIGSELPQAPLIG